MKNGQIRSHAIAPLLGCRVHKTRIPTSTSLLEPDRCETVRAGTFHSLNLRRPITTAILTRSCRVAQALQSISINKYLDSGIDSRVDTLQRGTKRIAKTLHSGAVAKAAGVSPDTIRHYEKIGLLPRASRTESGYRVYPESAVERVLVVRRALRIGFSLPELAEVLRARDAGGAPCQRVYKLAQEKLRGVTADIEALKQTERYLKRVLGDWEDRMKRTAPGQKSNLLHSLTGAVSGCKANQFGRRRT